MSGLMLEKENPAYKFRNFLLTSGLFKPEILSNGSKWTEASKEDALEYIEVLKTIITKG